MSEIHDAIKNGDLKAVRELLNKKSKLINQIDAQGDSPLHIALGRLRDSRTDPSETKIFLEIIDELLSRENIDLDLKNSKNKSPVELFARYLFKHEFNNYVPLLQKIMDKNNNYIVEIFHGAIYAHNLDVVKYLLFLDPNLIYKKDKRGFTPYIICLAASAGNVEQFFYRNYPDMENKETKLAIDFSSPQSTTTIIKAAFIYENEGMRAEFNKILDELYNNPEFRPALDIVSLSLIEQRSQSNKSIRIFIADADNVSNLTPKSTGYGDFDLDANILRIGGVRNRDELKGTLIHELTHLAALITYSNSTKPYRSSSPEEKTYKEAIQKMSDAVSAQPTFHALETTLSDLLVNRIYSYASKEESFNKEAGSLTDPEWIVSVPQGLVLYGNFYESETKSLIETMSSPMLGYWRTQFNQDATNTFNSHSKRSLIDTDIEIEEKHDIKKTILTTNFESVKKALIERRFEFLEPEKIGDKIGHYEQFQIVNQLLLGSGLDTISNLLPSEIILGDARMLANHPMFSSLQYKNISIELYNEITKIWNKAGNPSQFSFSSLDQSAIETLQSMIPNKLHNKITNVVTHWGKVVNSRFDAIEICVSQALDDLVVNRKVNKKDFDNLRQELVKYVYLHFPLEKEIPHELRKIISDSLLEERIIKASPNVFNRSYHSIKLDGQSIEKCAQSAVNVCFSRIEHELGSESVHKSFK